MRGLSLLFFVPLLIGPRVFAQAPASESPADTTPATPSEAPGPEDLAVPVFDRSRLDLPPREAFGSAWQPDTTPVSGLRARARAWDFRLDFNLFAGDDAQTSPRGGHQWISTNWFSLLLGRRIQGGDFAGRVVLSAEPLTLFNGEPITAGPRGYPLLFQSGQTYADQPLVDVQHPQDFFLEIALTYRHLLSKDVGLSFYVAPVGEPALGPVSYLHRASALANPFAPLSVHWLDASHVSFGVFTGGVYTKLWKLEASWFNGRLPNENRWDLELASLDSVSARFSLNPFEQLSAQVSYGYLRNPDPLDPGPVQRITASVLHDLPLGGGSHWASTLAWGRNITDHGTTDAALLESTLTLGHHVAFGRAELMVKPARALQFTAPDGTPESAYPVTALTLGYLFQLQPTGQLQVGLGACGTVNVSPAVLTPLYGKYPLGGMVYLRLGLAPAPPAPPRQDELGLP